ncbi:MAG: peptidylprolyl isomerase [Oscillospiraceae bacterium]|nr:peptidylprolyl isomerase [Oscillospiraceae bacterium]
MLRKILTAVLVSALIFGTVTACDKNTSKNSTDNSKKNEDITLAVKTVNFPVNGGEGNVGNHTIGEGEEYLAIKVTGYANEIIIKLYPEYEKAAVNQISSLAKEGFYKGNKVHRIIRGFMLQAGSKNGDGMSSNTEPSFEITTNEKMRHIYGAVCMANNGLSNGSQFYIVNNTDKNALTDFVGEQLGTYKSYGDKYANVVRFAENATADITKTYDTLGGVPFLDGGYTVFGQTIAGWETIDAVSAVAVKGNSSGEASTPVEPVIIENIEVRTGPYNA